MDPGYASALTVPERAHSRSGVCCRLGNPNRTRSCEIGYLPSCANPITHRTNEPSVNWSSVNFGPCLSGPRPRLFETPPGRPDLEKSFGCFERDRGWSFRWVGVGGGDNPDHGAWNVCVKWTGRRSRLTANLPRDLSWHRYQLNRKIFPMQPRTNRNSPGEANLLLFWQIIQFFGETIELPHKLISPEESIIFEDGRGITERTAAVARPPARLHHVAVFRPYITQYGSEGVTAESE